MQDCRPAPLIWAKKLDAYVEEWFLRKFGDGLICETVFDPGNGITERVAEIRATRERMRGDREAELYDSPDDAQWFRQRYAALRQELVSREREPQRPREWSAAPPGRPSRTAGKRHPMSRPARRC
ncbi:hypothetical protein AAHZ94_03115 [Streptomyces sp. HSW2009]|uniref:hypothetical protein n=1 Tax=Streptomyces sp. HSW2009 TaxID=3142890 RepID=UPI0032EBEC7A